jgi:peptidoglycan/xylan/chitin deacetylase (PgdA/CDA1 family)
VPPELDRGPATRPVVALTFDAGSSPAPTSAILQALAAADLRCTFFLTGTWAVQNPELVRRIAARGHELGNHTYSHPDLRRVSSARVAQELDRTDKLVRHLTGRGTRPYFRPPFGARDPRVLRDAARRGYRCVYWTTDSLDSVQRGITPRQIERRVLTRLCPGSIILMHCGSSATAQALPHLLAALHHRGYRVVTVSELLRAG